MSEGGTEDFITVITSADGKILTKRHRADGTTIPYNKGYLFTSRKLPINSLDDLAAALECPPDSAVILGRSIEWSTPEQPHRRLLHNDPKTGDLANYEPAAHAYAILDIDEKETPVAWLRDISGTVARVIRDWLPQELHGVDVVSRLTGSAGIKPGVRLRLAFLLDRTVTGEELRTWFTDCPNVDAKVFNPVQLIYGSPVFDAGDPIKGPRSGIIRSGKRRATPPADLAERMAAKQEFAKSVGWQQGNPTALDEIRDMFATIPAPDDYDLIWRLAASVAAMNVPEDPGMEERCARFMDWANSGSVDDNDGQEFEASFWRAAKPMDKISAGTLVWMSQQHGYELPSKIPEPNGDFAEKFGDVARGLSLAEGETSPDPFAPRQIVGQSMFADGDDWPVAYTAQQREPAKPLVELIPDYAEKHVVTFLEGLGGVGKSLDALQDALCISAGQPIYSATEIIVQADALYLNYEEPKDEIDRRIEKLVEVFGIDAGNFHLWQLKEHPRPIIAVNPKGEIWLTHFGNRMLHWLAERRERGLHTFVVFDGIIDAIWFDGSTRSDDNIARQVIAELDRLCLEYDFTAYAILHPSRAGERSGTGSYAPAWSTKPRSIQTFTKVNLAGGNITEHTPRSHVGMRRKVIKRSHGADGACMNLEYDRGSWRVTGQRSGGEDATEVAIEFAIHAAERGTPIRRDGKTAVNGAPLVLANGSPNNQHFLIEAYRMRTGKQHGAAHLLGELERAAKDGRLIYEEGKSHRRAGYRPVDAADLN